MFNPSATPPRSPRKEGSFFTSNMDYRSGEPRSLKASSSTSSLVSPSKSRRIRAAVKNLKIRTDASSAHGSMENVQTLPYGLAQSYINESMHSPLPSPSHRKPPSVHSALNSRSSSVSSLGSRERSVERSRESPFGNRDYPGGHFRDRSLDRQTETHYRTMNDNDTYQTYGCRDRSRDYPFMGARSLERDHSNLHRSKSIDQEYLATHSHYLPNQPDYVHTRETLVLDLQSQIADLNKECAIMQQNLDITKEKLSSSMNSIKTFWSPELKKERMLRKEENNKTIALSERLKYAIAEKQKLVAQLNEAENQLKQVQQGTSLNDVTSASTNSGSSLSGDSKNDAKSTQKRDRQSKEILLLRKTIEEMELRIETQKQTLVARDASIKKLLEMLQSKGVISSAAQFEHDAAEKDRLRERTLAHEAKIARLEKLLDQRDKEVAFLSEELENFKAREKSPDFLAPEKRNSADLLTLEAMVETKDGRISNLEYEIDRLQRELEIYKTGSDSLLSTPDLLSDKMSVTSSQDGSWAAPNDKYLKSKVDSLKTELNRKDTEVLGLKAQIESAASQTVDKERMISVLREQVQAKEQQCAHIQHDLDSLRERIEEKDAQLEVKSRTLAAAHHEQQRACAQVTELRDQLDVSERKTQTGNRKISQLEEQVREKDAQFRSVQSRLSSLQNDRSSRDSAVESLQHTITDQNRQIDKLKDKLDRREVDHQEEVDILQSTIRELKNKVTSCEAALSDRQREIAELKTGHTELQKERLRKDTQMKEFKDNLHRKTHEVKRLEQEIQNKEQELKNKEQELMSKSEQIKGLEERVKEVAELKGGSIELKKEKVRRDAYIKELKDELQSKVLELQRLHEQLQQVNTQKASEGSESHRKLQELEQELKDLKKEVQQRDGEVTRTQTEVDRLLDILRTTENEKNAKDKQIKDLHEQIKDYKQKLGTIKKSQQSEQSTQQQALEETRKNASEDSQQLKSLLQMKDERVEELEEALRESVKITAHREMVLHDLDVKVKKAEIQLRTKNMEMEDMKEKCLEAGEEVIQLRERLAERGEELHNMSSERNKYLLDAFDMKQEAILAAIEEKDAHIAVIEMTPNLPQSQTVPEVEKLTSQKHELQRKLKELTEERMKVLQQEEKTKNNSTLTRRLSQKAKSRTS